MSKTGSRIEFVPVYGLCDSLEAWIKKSFEGAPSPVESFEKDDDWTFIVKMHAFMEAGLNHLLVRHFDNKLTEIVPKLRTGGECGKMAFIGAWDLLPKPFAHFVTAFSTLRNSAVHDVTTFRIKLNEYVAKLDDKGLKLWKKGLVCWMITSDQKSVEHGSDLAVRYPRHAIFSCCMALLARAYVHELTKNAQDGLRASIHDLGEVWLYQFQAPNEPKAAAAKE